MVSKKSLRFSSIAVGFFIFGVSVTLVFLGDFESPSANADWSPASGSSSAQRLRQALAHAKTRIGLLEEQLHELSGDLPSSTALITSGSASQRSEYSAADEASGDIALVTSESSAEDDLLALLERAKNGELKLTDEEVKERVSIMKSRFTDALEAKDGTSAMEAMMALSKLDERAFPDLVAMWSEMRANRWLGLNGGQRRLWFNAEVFEWALKEQTLGGDPKQDLAFKTQALRYLPWYETDNGKQVETYEKLLNDVEAPAGELSDDERKRLRRGWRKNGDLYRGALARIGQINDPQSEKILSDVLTRRDSPADVQAMALHGLSRQNSRESGRLIERYLNDPNPAIRRAATIAQVRFNPPANGIMISGVNKRSPFRKQGIAPGSVITKFNGQRIRNNNDLKRAIRKARGKPVTVEVNRGGVVSQVQIKGNGNLGINSEPVRRR